MGNWNITIQGIGAHHNQNNPSDANRMAEDFVRQLIAAGHAVTHATITYGGEENITHPLDKEEESKVWDKK